jgi:all-trans-retinol 13,14-reductase
VKSVLGGISVAALDWTAFPRGVSAAEDKNHYDAVIIGAGLGGLSCATALARQGFRPLVLEKHYIPGGYATTFKRRDFVFDVSLHCTTVRERDGLYNFIEGFPEITDVRFVPHPDCYRAIYPDYDIRVPQKNLRGYMDMLVRYFPEEKDGIAGIFEDMTGLAADLDRFLDAEGAIDMRRVPTEFPYLYKCYDKTWGQMLDARIKNPKLKSIISAQWGYYGLPPSKLAGSYYALPYLEFLQRGAYYARGKSQKISDAFVRFIKERGGTVMLGTRVEKILVKDHAAYGVQTADGKTFFGKAVVSNANPYDTFRTMMDEQDYLKEYLDRLAQFSVSLSSFQIWLGLKTDLVGQVGVHDSEIFYNTGYDIEAGYDACVKADVESGGFLVALYDNIYEGYSPPGENIITILTLQGYDHWKKYESEYFRGNKTAYRAEKERMGDVLIRKVEETLLPGLSQAIEVKEIGTPLTNVRYTGNYRGAIYGYDQTLNNSGPNRLEHTTPIKNLYLCGAWTSPGHGYGGVIPSGLQCFAEIMKTW